MKKLLALLLSLTTVFSLCACGASEVPASVEEAPKEIVTITFKDGLTRLGQVKAEAETLVSEGAQYEEKEGFEFLGWYETPSFLETSKKDLAVDTFTENKTLYGSWKSLVLTEDTRTFYIVGDGSSPVLKSSAWAGDVSDDVKNACMLVPTGNTNEKSITVDLFKDDLFQVIYDWQWEGQYGFGKVTDCDASMFESGGGLSGEASKANISVLMDGNYTITLLTDVDNPALDVFSIVRNGDPVGEAVKAGPAYEVNENTIAVVKGSFVADWSENIELEPTDEPFVFTLTKEFEAGTELYFMLWEDGNDTGLGMKYSSVDEASKALLDEADNVKLSEAGTYTFTVNVKDMTISISK